MLNRLTSNQNLRENTTFKNAVDLLLNMDSILFYLTH